MAMENKRIIQLSTERLTLSGDDYVMVDSETDGSAKYRLDRLKETDSTLSVPGMAADAAATGQAISEEAQARTQAVTAETQARQAADTALGEDIDDLKSALSVPIGVLKTPVDFIGYKANVTQIENKVTATVIGSNWYSVGIKNAPLKFKANGIEYVIIAYGTSPETPAYESILAVVINNTGSFGKGYVFAHHIGNNTLGTDHAYDTRLLSANATYSANPKIEYSFSGTEVTIVYNGKSNTVDISNIPVSTSSGITGNFSTPMVGVVCHSGVQGSSYTLTYETAIDELDARLDVIENLQGRQWDGKKWFAFGDSITDYGYYIPTVDAELGTESTKYGHGGYSYAQLASVYTEMIGGATPDLITLFAGTNDFGHSGTIEAMRGGMETIINGLYTAFPKVQLVIITPLQRNFDATQYPTETSGLGPNSLGKYLIDYVEVIREVAEKYSIPCLDFYSMGGINANNASVKTIDGLHPNSSYGVNLGFMIAEFIKGYKPFN